MFIKFYADGFTCGDMGLKNADGSDDKVYSKGGACGLYKQAVDLACQDPEEETISYFYGQALSTLGCDDFKMENYP